MKRKVTYYLIVVLALLLAPHICQAQSSTIQFETAHWYEILNKAKASGKYIFVAVHASYCQPCKKMEKEVYTHPKVVDLHNTHFVNYKVNIGDPKDNHFTELYDIKSLPSHFYFNENGQLLSSIEGEKKSTDFFLVGDRIVSKYKERRVNQNNARLIKLADLKVAYAQGGLPPELLLDLAYYLKSNKEPFDQVVIDYLATQEGQYHTTENKEFIFHFATSLNNPALQLLLKELAFFKDNYGARNVNELVKTAIYNSILGAINHKSTMQLRRSLSLIDQASIPDADKFRFEMEAVYLQAIGDWRNYAKLASNYLNKFQITDPRLLNDIAMNFYLQVNNKRRLQEALSWVKQSIKIEDEYYNNEMQSLLLLKLGKHKAAIQAADRALYIARLRGADVQAAVNLKNKIQQTIIPAKENLSLR